MADSVSLSRATASGMRRASAFAYGCNQCGRCCHDQVITLSPYDVLRLARAAGLSTTDAIRRFTGRRGSLLRFNPDGACAGLEGVRCTLHRGRPLACRLYPLGLERDGICERFVRLEPAPGSRGVYGNTGTVGEFLRGQGVDEYLAMNARYRTLLEPMRQRILTLVDFASMEPREFWRRAIREALRETSFDPNPLVDAIFDADRCGAEASCDLRVAIDVTVARHLATLAAMVRVATEPAALASAAILLAISLGYGPEEIARR